MRKYILMMVVLCGISDLSSQDYFQQEVDYDIKVVLIDSIHTLVGEIEITYKNNSPDDLDSIFMHLWGNAFSSRTTAFTKQKIRTFNTDIYFADEEELSGYSGLEFKVGGTPILWKLDEEHVDIAVLRLRESLKPGDEIVISTPFSLRIPNSFSRLGHVETSYQMTQWYPKPAVYDKNGWHPMPYLDMGEFYSEFGSFQVEITLPENYYVGATGTLETVAERNFLEERVKYTEAYLEDSTMLHTEFPESSSRNKTLSYTAERVHDFAWFADKRFLVLKEEAELSSGARVDCWVYFTDYEKNLWKDGAAYTKRAVEFYSENVGEYPYPHASAVQSALSAGAGMEYPMITVIGGSGTAAALDQVITHEVGHNWFYGILASNERDHAWMDEGLNSFHDHKYMDVYYENYKEMGDLLPKRIERQMEYSAFHYGYQIYAKLAKDQAPNTTSDDLTTVNYGLGAYEKPAIAFKILEGWVGEENFIKAMKDYYQNWSYRHPQPEDVKRSFEESTGKDLDWLFDGMMYSNEVYDYRLLETDVGSGEISLENTGSIAPPFSITYTMDSTFSETVWYDGFTGEGTVSYPDLSGKNVELDAERMSMDVNPGNNDLLRKRSQLKFLTGLKTSSTRKLFYVPVLGVNTASAAHLGLLFHNYGIPLSNFQYYINPSVGIRKGSLVGSFEFRNDFPRRKGTLRNISLALGGKSYNEKYVERFDYAVRFARIQPSIDLEWKKKEVSMVTHYLTYRPLAIMSERARIGPDMVYEGKDRNWAFIHNAGYNYVRRSPISPLNIKANVEYRQYTRGENKNRYIKVYGEATAKYAYKRNKFVEIRGFAGFFPIHSERDISTSAALGNFSLFHRGDNDYRYDHHFVDRRGQDGFLSRQVTMSDGGFKNGLTNSMPIGLSNNYMASLNLVVDLPFGWTSKLPIKPYFDAGLYSFKPFTDEALTQEVLWSGGLMLDFRKVFMIHVPLFYSEKIKNVYDQTSSNVLQRISFTIDLNKLDPHRMKHFFWR